MTRNLHATTCFCRSSQGGGTPESGPSSGGFRASGLRAGKGGVASRYASTGAFGRQPKSSDGGGGGGGGGAFASLDGCSAFMPPGAAASGAKVSGIPLHERFCPIALKAKSFVDGVLPADAVLLALAAAAGLLAK